MARKLKPAQTDREWWAILKSKDKTFIRSMSDWKKALANPKTNPLKGCDPKVINHFTKSLKFEKGGLAHGNYGEVAKALSYFQFRDLLGRFGISLNLFEDHKDYACDGKHTCNYSITDWCMSNC